MKKFLLIVAFLIGALLLFALTIGEKTLLNLRAQQTEKTSLAALKQLVSKNIIIRTPDAGTWGPGPYPVIFQFHGCAGARLEFQELRAESAIKHGYTAVIVDSMRPRNIDRQQALDTVCAGKSLLGQERAGDIAAAMDLILERDDIDAERIILTGWSHGAWSVMDYLTMDFDKNVPANLESQAFEGKTLPQIDGVILFYPYCGIGTRTRLAPWVQKPKVLTLIAGADNIVNHKECLKEFDNLKKQGLAIDQTVYPDTEHAFDDPFIEDDWRDWHNPENMRDAMARYEAFIKTLR